MPKYKRFILLLELCSFCQKFCIIALCSPVGLHHHLVQPIVLRTSKAMFKYQTYVLYTVMHTIIYAVTHAHTLFIEKSRGL